MKIKNATFSIGTIAALCISVAATAGQGDGNLNGFSGSGVFVLDSDGTTFQTTAQAPIPGYFELSAASESTTWASHSVFRIDCVQSASEPNEYFVSGYKTANSRVSFVNRLQLKKDGTPDSKTFSKDNVSVLGDKFVGRFKVEGDTLRRSNWTSGIENCIGVGIPQFGNNDVNPLTKNAYESCSADSSNWVDLPDCDELTWEQQDSLILDRTTRTGIDTLTYTP